LWKAEKWDPDRLIQLYKKAGAKYFVSMGSHHDNFFLWNSKLHQWNSVNMGPKRDVVGEWQKAAQKYGLKFGVSEHLGASFTWFQASHGADKTGPLAGVPYDGANAKFEDLYHFKANPGDTGWYSKDPRWQRQWYAEIKELVDNYHPDLLYSDGAVPFGNEVGLSMIAHLYNSNAAAHGGKCEAIYNCKQKSDGRWVEDLERGIMPRIEPHPWQTDTSIGDWYYNRNWKFRPVSWVIHMLVDNVSKNGNLLLNVVQRPDGSLDPEVEKMLEQLADWSAIHGEAIFGSRPWQIYGESSVKVKGGNFNENFKYNAKEIRFTTQGAVLYAIALGWPQGEPLVIRSLAKPTGENVNQITSIKLLGYDGDIVWKQTPEALMVTLPEKPVSEFTAALKITGTALKPIPFAAPESTIRPDAKGNLTLDADAAELHGRLKTEDHNGKSNIGFWDNPSDWASWKVDFTKSGVFGVSAQIAASNSGSEFIVEVAGQQLIGKAKPTGDWAKFEGVDIGTIEIKQPGVQEVKLRPRDPKSWKAINLREIKFHAGQRLGQESQKVKTFIDYFLPMPIVEPLSKEAWGGKEVGARDTKNGLEDPTMKQWCYWDGQIIKDPGGKYHLFASRWDQTKGHREWWNSKAVHSVSDKLIGPYTDTGLCWPNDQGGKGHNVTALTLPDGKYAVVISETRPGTVYVSKSPEGPWEQLGTITGEGLRASNVSILVRPDGDYMIVPRSGQVFISSAANGILGPYKATGPSAFPKGIPNLEDPAVFFSGGLYHIVVNSWSTRKAYHLTSQDGKSNWINRGLAYDPTTDFCRYTDGTVNHWHKLERPGVVLENGHVVAVSLAVLDSPKEEQRGNNGHGSKIIVVPFDGAALDRDLQNPANEINR